MIFHAIVSRSGRLNYFGPNLVLYESERVADHMFEKMIVPDRRRLWKVVAVRVEVEDDTDSRAAEGVEGPVVQPGGEHDDPAVLPGDVGPCQDCSCGKLSREAAKNGPGRLDPVD